MPDPREQRLQFAYGLLFDATRWVEQIAADVPQLKPQLSHASDHILQAAGWIEDAKMDARTKSAVMAIAASIDLEDES